MNEIQRHRAVESMRKEAALQGLSLPEKVIRFTASLVKPTRGHHAGAVILLKAQQSLNKAPLSVDGARNVLRLLDYREDRREIAERKRRDSITMASTVKGASNSWPKIPKTDDLVKVFNKTYDSARTRTRAKLTRWMKELRTRSKYRFSVDTIPPNDPNAIETLLRQQTNDFMNLPAWARGCDWQSFQALLKVMQPSSVTDIAIGFALCQKRAVQYGKTARYLALVNRSRNAPTDALIERITRNTRGCIVFKEQLMEVGWMIAGYSIENAEKFRMSLNWWRKEERLENARLDFLRATHLRGIPRLRALRIFEECSKAGRGGLTSRCQALEYSNLNYRIAYMKTYFPRETKE